MLMLLLASVIIGCASHEAVPKEPERIDWLDEAESMKGLRGIVLRPYPEVFDSEKYYSERRPHCVNYVFWNGWIREVTRDWHGKVGSDRWISPKKVSFDPDEIFTVKQWRERLEKGHAE